MSSDKYNGDEQESQVRSIIKQLNEERPSKEKSREVVVRPDGTKVVRVIKKRKVMISSAEKNRSAKKRFLLLTLLLLLVGVAMAVIVSVRMSAMAGESYIQQRQEELCRAWGAKSVHCAGAGISGFNLQIESLVAEFPESSVLQRVELRGIRSSLATTSFFSGMPESDELKIENAVVILREGVQKFSMPKQNGDDLWKFKRVSCGKFSMHVGEEATSPLSIKQASAYMYFASSGRATRTLTLGEGVLQMHGWKPIVITDAQMNFSDTSVDDIRLTGTLDVDKKDQDTASTRVSINGSLRDGSDMAGPFDFESVNIKFSDLSDNRFAQFFNAVTTAERGPKTLSAYVTLPLQRPTPLFAGSFRLKDVRLTPFPAMQMITEHLEPMRRKSYLPTCITEATAELVQEGEKTTLRIAEGGAVERELISLHLNVSIDTANQLSGTMSYGIPSKLTRVEYPDGLADPLFTDDGVYAWLTSTVSGYANAPSDNAAELEAKAAVVRVERPARIPFDEIDIDDFSDKMKARDAGKQTAPATQTGQPDTPAPAPAQQQQPTQPQPPASDYDLSKLPTTTPLEGGGNSSGGGLSLPTDEGFFPGLHH